MDAVKRSLGMAPEEPSLLDEGTGTSEAFCGLSLKQRIIGFVICAVIAVLLFMWSFIMLIGAFTSPKSWCAIFACANIAFFASTMFLVGPVKQLKSCFHPSRAIAAIVYLLALVFAFIAVLVIDSWLLALLAVIVLVCAFVWYIFSYIPYGQTCIMNACKGCCGSLGV